MIRDLRYSLLAVVVLALTVVPIGTAVFLLGFVNGDSPCVMCWEQRIGMALIALLGLFILRYGPRPAYVGLAILVAAWGIHMGLRHTGLHAARDVGQGFSIEILGAHTYTWSVFVFWVSIVTMGVLMLVVREADVPRAPRVLQPLERLAMVVFLVVIAGNIVQAFASTGPPPYLGQGDPVRFSFNPRHWVWSLDEYSPAPVTLRGRWAVEKPEVPAPAADSLSGPLADLPVLRVAGAVSLALPLRGTVTDLAYDTGSDRFVLTTQHGVYITDGSLSRIIRAAVVDPGFSVDLGRLAGASFLAPQQVVALSENKSYVVLRESDDADADQDFRFFLESPEQFDEVRRSRFGTVRARMMYVMSLAVRPERGSLYTVTVPNRQVRQLVVSRFDLADWTLSEEFLPSIAPEAGVALRDKAQSLGELFVTGATIAGGRMYAVDAAYGTLLTIDLDRRAVIAAHTIPGLSRPTGIAVRGEQLYVADAGGAVTMVAMPE